MLIFMYLFCGIALSFSLEILENYRVFELNVLHQNVNVMCLESAIISISSFPVIKPDAILPSAASLLLGMNNGRSSRQRSDSPFSLPRQKRRTTYLSIESDSESEDEVRY